MTGAPMVENANSSVTKKGNIQNSSIYSLKLLKFPIFCHFMPKSSVTTLAGVAFSTMGRIAITQGSDNLRIRQNP